MSALEFGSVHIEGRIGRVAAWRDAEGRVWKTRTASGALHNPCGSKVAATWRPETALTEADL